MQGALKSTKDVGENAAQYSNTTALVDELALCRLEVIKEPALLSLISEAMHCTRLDNPYSPESNEHHIWNTSANVVAPVLTSYVYWILKRAREDEIEHLYFIARDGWVLHKIAVEIIKSQNIDIGISYLYGSRHSWHGPAQFCAGEVGFDWIFDNTSHLSLKTIFDRVNLKVLDYIDYFSGLVSENEIDRNLNNNERESVKQIFVSSPNLQRSVIQSSEESFLLAKDYLRQQGFSVEQRSGIVDIGWNGRLQKSLACILDYAGLRPKCGIRGYYFGLIRVPETLPNEKYSAFTYNYASSPSRSFLEAYTTMLEHFMMADHGSTIGYSKSANGLVTPVLRNQENTAAVKWGIYAQADSITQYARVFSKNVSIHDIQVAGLETIATGILKRFFKAPTYLEATIYGNALFFEDQNETIGRFIAPRPTYFEIFKLVFFRGAQPYNGYWLEAAIARHKHISPLLKGLLGLRRTVIGFIGKLRATRVALAE
ncbi:hypothetical protein [Microbulbifer sp. MCCC 1A16149]|uniref:hypothetical protein n=1 Tax=Microbulbifer sp. MCCC 1A16149 TaxID=3411322 RepID=UPI003D0E75C3